MGIINYLKNIYCGKDNILNNIILFSLSGIWAISWGKCCAHYLNSFYFGYLPASEWVINICTFLVIMISMYIPGYLYNYSHILYKEESLLLPEVKMDAYLAFFKMIPILLFWGINITILVFWGLILFNIQEDFIKMMLYYVLLGCLIPFINVLYVLYSKKFETSMYLFNPINLFNILHKTFVPVVILTAKCAIILGIIFVILYKLFIISNNVANTNLQHAMRLLFLTCCIYFANTVNLINIQGIVEITKSENL